MTRVYECDNCGEQADAMRMVLVETQLAFVDKPASTVETDEYHVCEGCWDELGWDE